MNRRAARAIAAALSFGLAGANAGTAQNRQPISTSLTECAVIYEEIATEGARRGAMSRPEIPELQENAQRFRVEALAQARREGRRDPKSHLEEETTRLTSKWDGRFANLLEIRNNADWLDYCRALGRSRGIVDR
ncbi:hypothetical protein [Marimonas lutisalis]|uniref:hypothetical protein n=1 Tax=Marimonas lutisalis TaxID=2545756 RepID=UPI0010F7A529|nr:hypothetical protein [Marimonas lutisalis]